MMALVGLFGMFTAKSTNTLKFNHIPGRVYARAGGTASSLEQRDRIEKAAVSEAQAETPTALPGIAVPVSPVMARVRCQAPLPLPASPALWPPTLLFRPPPALSVA